MTDREKEHICNNCDLDEFYNDIDSKSCLILIQVILNRKFNDDLTKLIMIEQFIENCISVGQVLSEEKWTL